MYFVIVGHQQEVAVGDVKTGNSRVIILVRHQLEYLIFIKNFYALATNFTLTKINLTLRLRCKYMKEICILMHCKKEEYI